MVPSDAMRVLFVIGTMGRGGAEIQVKELALELASRGHAVGIVVMLPFLDFEDALRAGGIEAMSLGMARGVPTARAVVALARFARRFKPDVVHAHMYAGILLSRAVRCLPPGVRGKWKALVCTSHSGKERTRARYLAYRLTSSLSEQWTSVSRDGLANYRAHGALGSGAAVYVPNGIDTERFRPDPSSREETRAALGIGDEFMWLAVGSFNNEDKDQSNLLHAFARLVKAGSPSELVIAGNGVLLDDKRALASALDIDDRVRFLGMSSEVPLLLRAADAYVLSSQQEALPLAVLEAAATALPIVTTDVGDCSLVVNDGKGGFVVPPRDSERLASAMARVEALDACARLRMGEAARELVLAEFSLSALVERWERMYRDLGAS
jgi:glycosyltransferase involved in cell wall biosynthesis